MVETGDTLGALAVSEQHSGDLGRGSKQEPLLSAGFHLVSPSWASNEPSSSHFAEALGGAGGRVRTKARAGRGRLRLVASWVRASAAPGTASWVVAGGREAGRGRAEEVVVGRHSSAGIRKKISTTRKQIITENMNIILWCQ